MENLCPMRSARRDLLATASDGQVDLGVAWVNEKAKFEKYVYIFRSIRKICDMYMLSYICVRVCLWLRL